VVEPGKDRGTVNEIQIQAPAKINLGLEILGRRDDGYHEIRTVLAMLELADTLTVKVSQSSGGEDLDGLPAGENLVGRALDAFRKAVPSSPPVQWNLVKRIPAAAGLGGASSDAATALMAANALAGYPLTHTDLADIAGSLGSDTTFFLGPPFSLATGRGTEISPIPPLLSDVLLVVPREALAAKTATMYRELKPTDFTTGQRVTDIASSFLRSGIALGTGEVVNAFSRPLVTLLPRVGQLQDALRNLGDFPYGLSGAGPAHFVLAPKEVHPEIEDSLTAEFGDWLGFHSTVTRTRPISSNMGGPA
jgi:4-diphosphocytidyl-2-C-methyl-D-erythritol kinase